jgi:hypothetical protein
MATLDDLLLTDPTKIAEFESTLLSIEQLRSKRRRAGRFPCRWCGQVKLNTSNFNHDVPADCLRRLQELKSDLLRRLRPQIRELWLIDKRLKRCRDEFFGDRIADKSHV